jgi:predicted metalloendopeptidase
MAITDFVKNKADLIRVFKQHQNLEKEQKHAETDFYTYVNAVWLKNTHIQNKLNYYVKYDEVRTVQDKVYYQLIYYVQTFIKEQPHTKKGRALKNLYHSLTANTTPSLKKNCHQIQHTLEQYFVQGQMVDLLAYINRSLILSWSSPIAWKVLPDEKNVKQYISHLFPPVLGLTDYTLYLTDPQDTAKVKAHKQYIKEHYLKYIKAVFTACLGANTPVNPRDIWTVETDLLVALGCEAADDDQPKNLKKHTEAAADNKFSFYNVLSSAELIKDYAFNWPEFAAKIGFKKIPQKIIVQNPPALKCLVKLLEKNWNTPAWKTYWLFLHYKQIIRFEDSLRHIHFDFHEKILKGQPVQMPNEIYPIFALSMTFNTFLTEQYVAHNSKPLYEKYTEHLLEDLRYVFIKKIKRNTWLAPTTRQAAIKKLEKIKLFVGTSGKLRQDPLLAYRADDPWYNLLLLADWKHYKFIELEGQPIIDIPEIDWNNFKLIGTQAYMVNAYYRATSNSIFVPLAYLQKPFIDLDERGIESNLAAIGYTLGHELSHSLDNHGHMFDADGNLHNWWTPADQTNYAAKIADVKKQYETFAKKDGILFDAALSIGEDLADISGLALVEEYLTEYNKIHQTMDMLQKLSLKHFYIHVTQNARQKIYKAAVQAQLLTNPHPLEKYRINCALARLELFRTIYVIKKGDGMYWHNTDTIW